MWARRLVTIPMYFALSALALVALPLFLAAAALADLVTGRPAVFLRCVLYFTVYLWCETFGIIASFLVWLAAAVSGRIKSEEYQRWNLRLQSMWASVLWTAGKRIFGLRVRIENCGDLTKGPIILLVRHASIGDTVLPAVFVANRYGISLRYVLKRELLWDPCLDIVGNRLPNYFVRRGAVDGAAELAGVAGLMEGLGERDGVLLYPEGTRFSPAKLERIRKRFSESGDAESAGRAAVLTQVLPPRLGGVLTLLERNGTAATPADVVLLAHTGFEGAASFAEFLRGALVGREVRMKFWRVPAADIPADRQGRIDWIHDQWGAVDEWVARNRAPC